MTKQRLVLRDSVFEDCEKFAKWEANPAVNAFFTIDNTRNYEEVTREFVQRAGDDTQHQFTVCLKDTGEAIGRVYISNINNHYDSLDITRIYIAEPSERGKGYGEEALNLVLKWAFEQINVERVTLDHFSDNKIAASLYEKVGFVREGIMRHGGKKDGKYVDLYLMSMLKEEYQDC